MLSLEVTYREYPYEITIHYKVGSTSMHKSFDVKRPLDPSLLAELISSIQKDLGTSKQVFITSLYCREKRR